MSQARSLGSSEPMRRSYTASSSVSAATAGEGATPAGYTLYKSANAYSGHGAAQGTCASATGARCG